MTPNSQRHPLREREHFDGYRTYRIAGYQVCGKQKLISELDIKAVNLPLREARSITLKIAGEEDQRLLWRKKDGFHSTRDVLLLDGHDLGIINHPYVSGLEDCEPGYSGRYLLGILWSNTAGQEEPYQSELCVTSQAYIRCFSVTERREDKVEYRKR